MKSLPTSSRLSLIKQCFPTNNPGLWYSDTCPLQSVLGYSNRKIFEIDMAYFSSGMVAWVTVSVWLSSSPSLCCILIFVPPDRTVIEMILTLVCKRVHVVYVELRLSFSLLTLVIWSDVFEQASFAFLEFYNFLQFFTQTNLLYIICYICPLQQCASTDERR
jgi:hypothetical protein